MFGSRSQGSGTGQECEPLLCALGCHIKDTQPLPGTITVDTWQKDSAISLFTTEAPQNKAERNECLLKQPPLFLCLFLCKRQINPKQLSLAQIPCTPLAKELASDQGWHGSLWVLLGDSLHLWGQVSEPEGAAVTEPLNSRSEETSGASQEHPQLPLINESQAPSQQHLSKVHVRGSLGQQHLLPELQWN